MEKETMIDSQKLGYQERLCLWQEMLTREGGVTYKQFNNHIDNAFPDDSILRKDITNIKKLLKFADVTLEETGRPKHFHISDSSVDLLDLYYKYADTKPYSQILNLLTHMKGIFPDDFLRDLNRTFGDIVDKREEAEQYISFDSNIDMLDNMMFFSDIYFSITNHKVIDVTYHKINNEKQKYTLRLHPEFIKQYHSLWYVFGLCFDENGEDLGVKKIRLDLVNQVNEVRETFISSGTDYEDYFNEIVGVENIPSVKVWNIEFVVKNKMYNRLLTNPLHEEQKRCSKLDSIKPGYKGFSLKVKENIELIRKVLAYGSDIIIISPKNLNSKIKKELQKALRNYESIE